MNNPPHHPEQYLLLVTLSEAKGLFEMLRSAQHDLGVSLNNPSVTLSDRFPLKQGEPPILSMVRAVLGLYRREG